MNDQSFGALTRNVATILKNPSYLLSEFTRLFFHELKVPRYFLGNVRRNHRLYTLYCSKRNGQTQRKNTEA